jgi:preprotein translocase SecE subunit
MANEQQPVEESTGKVAMVRDYVIDSRQEMDKVTWPGRTELIASTRAVVIGSLLLGVTIGLVDKLLTLILVDGIASLAR